MCSSDLATLHGYTTAFWVSAAIFAAGAVICGLLMRPGKIQPVVSGESESESVSVMILSFGAVPAGYG